MTTARKKYLIIVIVVAAPLMMILCVIGMIGLPYAWFALDNQGTSPLFFARTIEAAKALVDSGANVNARSDYGFTPLHFASARGDSGVVRFLLEHGADVFAKSQEGDTPLHWATRHEWDPDEGKHYIAGPFDPKQKLECVKLLVQHGADVNAKNTSEDTPLFAAAEMDADLTKFLLEKGASADARDSMGFNPLHQAANAAIAELLINYGADVNARDKWEHRTPLFFAKYHDGVASVLAAHGGKQ